MSLLFPEALILLFAPLYLWIRDGSDKRLLAVLVLMILALSDPVRQLPQSEQKHRGTSAVIALDLSYSMQACDISPSRLEAAKETIRALLQQTSQNRYALFGFTTNALILSPFTSDTRLLLEAMDAIDTRNILTKGTSLAKLLQTLAKKKGLADTLILFSDGGEEYDLAALTHLAKAAGLHIVAVGMATPKGAMLYDAYGKALKKGDGALVVTRRNPLLAKLAHSSGGKFIAYRSPEETAAEVARTLSEVAEQKRFTSKEEGYRHYFWVPLALALVLFLLHFVRIPKKLLVMLPFLAQQADGAWLDWYHIQQAESAYMRGDFATAQQAFGKIGRETIQSRYNQALAAYRRHRYQTTITLLKPLQTTDPILKQKILFLLGNAYAKRAAYKKAAQAYRHALWLGEDPDILHNLQVILGKKSKSQPKPPAFRKKESDKKGIDAAAKQQPKTRYEQKASPKEAKRVPRKRPLGYKAYELINKGYIDEKNPW